MRLKQLISMIVSVVMIVSLNGMVPALAENTAEPEVPVSVEQPDGETAPFGEFPGGDEDPFGASYGGSFSIGPMAESFSADDVPDAYLQPCETQGRVERIRYRVESDDNTYVKRAMVYLPAGYDDSDRQYNILYLLHSAGGCVENFLDTEKVTEFQCLLDHLIANGEIEPLIVVAVSYYSDDNMGQYLPLAMQVPFAAAFPDVLTDTIIPAIEGTYRTYAESTDAEGIHASRDHRGIGGFSLGGTATWYTFLQKMDAFRWFVPISEASWDDGEGGIDGIWDSNLSARVIYDAVMEQEYGRDDFNLFVATGTEDTAFDITTSQMVSLLEYSDVFVTGVNTNCSMMIDGFHLFSSVYTYMYHILPMLFTD